MYTECWLSYELIRRSEKGRIRIFSEIGKPVLQSAVEEIRIGMKRMYDRDILVLTGKMEADGEDREVKAEREPGIYLELVEGVEADEEGFCITAGGGVCVIKAAGCSGILYGVFEMLRELSLKRCREFEDWTCEVQRRPDNPLRMLNHWDNMDGSIERGYSGMSFFFENHEVLSGRRVRDYARLAASVGINASVINNVNVRGTATELITAKYFDKVREISEIFAAYGIVLYLSVNYAAPIELGELDSADPCDEEVRGWWTEKAREIWENVPLLGGFLIKADSEGRPGPFTYGRTHAEGANMLADAVGAYGGRIIWRCFVYNCTQDWRDTVTDRAKAGYDNFHPLDGSFKENVILQIKNGPMDFQVREPASPLFGGMKSTNMILEVQIAQEYTGQQRHVCYLLPWFKEILETDMCLKGAAGKVKDIVGGRTYGQSVCGMAAVANTGSDVNWTGHDLAAVNWYGFGRLSYDTSLTAEEIAEEWIGLTFGGNEKVKENLMKILMMSWPAYEKYTSPLGIGWMVNPSHHYGPNVDGYEYDRWGTYHRADCRGIGVDRTKNGTGYCSQYNEPLAGIYEDAGSCPEELLLFFHHMPYTYILKTGKSIIQHIYDTHFEGAEEAELFLKLFGELEGLIEQEVYDRIYERLMHQREHAGEWRDIINAYFYRKSGIPDEKGRRIYA